MSDKQLFQFFNGGDSTFVVAEDAEAAREALEDAWGFDLGEEYGEENLEFGAIPDDRRFPVGLESDLVDAFPDEAVEDDGSGVAVVTLTAGEWVEHAETHWGENAIVGMSW